MAGPDPDTAADDGDDGEAPPKKTLWERITLLMVKAENPDDTRRRSGVRTDDEGPSTVDALEAAVATTRSGRSASSPPRSPRRSASCSRAACSATTPPP